MIFSKQFIFKRFFLLVLICMTSTTSLLAQTQEVEGVVKDAETGEGLPGVTVLIKNSTKGTITDFDGNYRISADMDETLVFSFVGYVSSEEPVRGRTVIDVNLDLDIQALEEIVITGYGQQRKSLVTGSITKIDAKTLSRSQDLRVEQALQGKAAGVVIMNNSGQPGDNLTIRIRGTGTNGNPDPLFIVDGLPLEKQALDFLNPSDIESIEVLKDATASAIYGTRGANGVVLITTKKGKIGQKLKVSYSGFYGVQNPWRELDLLNAEQYIDIMNEAAENDGRSQPLFSQALIDTINWSTDWQDEMYYRNAPKMSHTVSFEGGSDNGTYSSSINYFVQDGIIAEGQSRYERVTYRLNTSKKLDWFLLGSNINLVNVKSRGIEGNSQFGTGINQALNMPPIVPVMYGNGDWGIPNDFGIGLQEITNPTALLSINNSENQTYKTLGNLFVEFEPIKGLKIRSNFGGELAFVDFSSYTPSYYISPTNFRDANTATQSLNKFIRWNLDNTITYNKSIKKHNFTLLAGATWFKEFNESLSGTKDSLIFDSFDKAYLDNSILPEGQVSNGFGEHTLQSYFGRVYYNFDEKYLVEGVFRADGSSRFGANNRYAYFPAVAVGWAFTNESFFPKNKVVDFGKLRLSWGQNGSERIPDFQFTSTVSNGLSYFFGADQDLYDGIQPSFYSNPNLRWETSEQLDIGLDLSLWSGKMSFAMDYYVKTTKDWLVSGNSANPRLVGNNISFINGGAVENRGIELELGYKNNFSKKLFTSFSFTAATNKSEVQFIDNAEGELLGGQGIVGQDQVQRAVAGEPIGYFWGYKTAGIIQHPADLEDYPHLPNANVGDLIFVDLNNDGTLDDLDRTNIGNPFPKLTLGFNANIEYGAFDLSMFWYSALGHQIWRANRRADLFFSNYTTEVLDRWTGRDTSNEIPAVTLNDPNRSWRNPSDFFVFDADFLRLKNVTLGYNVPKALLDKIGLGGLRFYVTSENLFTFTKYPGMEVEVGGDPLSMGIDRGVYPQSRTFLGGMNVTF